MRRSLTAISDLEGASGRPWVQDGAVAGLHLWRRNALVSILVGTAVHVAIATALAGG